MVDVQFKSRAKHFVPLSVLKSIATATPGADAPGYLTSEDIDAIKGHFTYTQSKLMTYRLYARSGMALINRGRLSVQRVEQAAWDAIQKMADKGGWSERQTKKTGSQKKQTVGDSEGGAETSSKEPVKPKGNPRKRKTQQAEEDEGSVPVRRSTRTRTKV